MGRLEVADRKDVLIPKLYDEKLSPKDYAHTTCFSSGYLSQTNASWRSERPVINLKKCTACMQCYMYCPDASIYKIKNPLEDSKHEELVQVDLDFCKGCGICVEVCRFGSIRMVEEACEFREDLI